MKLSGNALIVVLALVAVGIYSSVFTVGERDLAIKFRFSEIVRADFEPGLHFVENTRIPHVESETFVAQVNKGPVMAIRCEQLPPSFTLIHVFNHVAAELKMDPTELALKNDGAVEVYGLTLARAV